MCELSNELGVHPDADKSEVCKPGEETYPETRAHFDAGNFDRVFAKHQHSKDKHLVTLSSEVDGSYMCILLVTLAMQVGAMITDAQRDYIRSNYQKAGLMVEGIEQIGRALDEYKCGTPYELIKPDRTEALAAHKREEEYVKRTYVDLSPHRYYTDQKAVAAFYWRIISAHAIMQRAYRTGLPISTRGNRMLTRSRTPDFVSVMTDRMRQQQGSRSSPMTFSEVWTETSKAAPGGISCDTCGKLKALLGHDLKRCANVSYASLTFLLQLAPIGLMIDDGSNTDHSARQLTTAIVPVRRKGTKSTRRSVPA